MLMRYLIVGTLLFLIGCSGIQVPDSYHYKEIQTKTYTLATWQKITDKTQPIRIYIEGDGHAFNYAGMPTSNPTPKGTFLREIAFNDPNPNVVYLARPCQYVTDSVCTQKDWTTGRFSQPIIDSTTEAIKTIAKDNKVVLIGYSGGALLSGLVIQQNPNLRVQKWITIAGLLNHTKWTDKLNLQPLTDSVELEQLPTILQKHYIGEKDTTIPVELLQSIVPADNLVVVKKATHDRGFDKEIKKVY